VYNLKKTNPNSWQGATINCCQKLAFLLLFILFGYSSESVAKPEVEAESETDIQCMYVQDNLMSELNKKYKSVNKKGLSKRRKRLNKLFKNTTPSCATILKTRLKDQRSNLKISELFHHKLATKTRKQLLKILDKRIKSSAKVIEGNIEIGITHDQITNAAKRAKRILADTQATDKNWQSLERLNCIVGGLHAKGKHFDDNYFPVAPMGKNLFGTDNPLTCYKKVNPKTKENNCRQGKNVIRHCRESFANAIVNNVIAGESDKELLNLMLRKEEAINRGLIYFRNMRKTARNIGGSKETENTLMCKSAVKYLIPKMSTNHNQDKIYNCYPNP